MSACQKAAQQARDVLAQQAKMDEDCGCDGGCSETARPKKTAPKKQKCTKQGPGCKNAACTKAADMAVDIINATADFSDGIPEFTFQHYRRVRMLGGVDPKALGFGKIGGRTGSVRRDSAGDVFGAKVTDCSGCSDSVEEWPGNNIQNLHATDWEPDGDGGCVRTLTQRDYTGSCVAGTSGGTPDGGECNSSDPRSPCCGSNTSTTKAYVYEDGQCYTTATCDCDGKEIRGGGQNCPDSQVTYTVRTVEDHDCAGTKRDAAWGGKAGPENPTSACPPVDPTPTGNSLTASAPGRARVSYKDGDDGCGGTHGGWSRSITRALALLVQDKDIAERAVCLEAKKCKDYIAAFLDGHTGVDFQVDVAPGFLGKPYGNARTNADGSISVFLYCGDSTSALAAVGPSGLFEHSITSQLVDLAGILLHELMHVCDGGSAENSGEWDFDYVPMAPDRVLGVFTNASKQRHGL